jgi:hypothetical protein
LGRSKGEPKMLLFMDQEQLGRDCVLLKGNKWRPAKLMPNLGEIVTCINI